MGKKRKAKAAGLDDYDYHLQSRFNNQIPLCPVEREEPIELTEKCQHYSHQDEVPRHLRKYVPFGNPPVA